MDPVLKSTLTSLASVGVGSALGWAVTQGYLTKDQAATLTTEIVGGGSIAIGGLLIWYKARQHTKVAQIQAVNAADNGVKVVASASPSPKVEEPLK